MIDYKERSYRTDYLELKLSMSFDIKWQFLEYNANDTMHNTQCIEYNSCNTIHWIQYIKYNALNTIHIIPCLENNA